MHEGHSKANLLQNAGLIQSRIVMILHKKYGNGSMHVKNNG